MALECKGRCHAARRVSSSHECIMDLIVNVVVVQELVFLFWREEGLNKGRRKAGSASGVRKDDVG